jgi:hypothetical protein
MKRHWEVELHQARRRVRVLEYLLRRADRPKPEPIIRTIMDRVAAIIKEHDMQSFRQIAERAADFGIAPNSVTAALKGLRESGRARVVNGRCHARWTVLPLLLLLAGCVSSPFSNVPEAEVVNRKSPIVNAVPALPQVNSLSRSSVAPVKTNGVVTLKWNNGDPADTVIVNQSTGIAYPATTAETLTVGGLPIGAVQTFIATNSAGSSAPASTVVTPDSMKLQVQTWLYLTWPGPAGTLQQTTNLVIWQDVQPIPSGGSYIVTNNAAKAFYRMKLN